MAGPAYQYQTWTGAPATLSPWLSTQGAAGWHVVYAGLLAVNLLFVILEKI